MRGWVGWFSRSSKSASPFLISSAATHAPTLQTLCGRRSHARSKQILTTAQVHNPWFFLYEGLRLYDGTWLTWGLSVFIDRFTNSEETSKELRPLCFWHQSSPKVNNFYFGLKLILNPIIWRSSMTAGRVFDRSNLNGWLRKWSCCLREKDKMNNSNDNRGAFLLNGTGRQNENSLYMKTGLVSSWLWQGHISTWDPNLLLNCHCPETGYYPVLWPCCNAR